MIRRAAWILALMFLLLQGCATPVPTWRAQAGALVAELEHQKVPSLFPQDYRNLLETFEHGEAVFQVQEDHKEADFYYQLALQKGSVLKGELIKLNRMLEEQKRQREAEEAARIEEERLMVQAAAAEEKLRLQEIERAVKEEQAAAAARLQAATREAVVVQVLSYTVRRGETLPQIAARAEIYNDASLWPLIYRANRDQIRNPTQLWPGQVLKIPRHFTRDEANEAKRYSGKK